MGQRVDRWPAENLNNLSVFFRQVGHKYTTEWKEEIIFNDPSKAKDMPSGAILPDGSTVTLSPTADPRQALADWLVGPDNPYFARCAANRSLGMALGPRNRTGAGRFSSG